MLIICKLDVFYLQARSQTFRDYGHGEAVVRCCIVFQVKKGQLDGIAYYAL